MKIISGLESFKQKVIENHESKKIDAWLNFLDFKQAFDVLFKRLYMTDLMRLRQKK